MTIAKIEWQNEKKTLFMWLLALIVILGFFMAFFPFMTNSEMSGIVTSMDALPKSMLDAFQLSDTTALLKVTGYFAYVFQYLLIALCLYTMMLGGRTLIKEESDGTIEFLYAQPVSRSQIFLAKVVTNVVMIAVLWIVLFIGSLVIALFLKTSTESTKTVMTIFLRIFGNELLIVYLFYFFGILCSPLVTSSRNISGIAMGIVFSTYIIGLLSALISEADWLKYFSPMQLATPAAMANHNLEVTEIVVMLLLCILCACISLLVYRRKDLKCL